MEQDRMAARAKPVAIIALLFLSASGAVAASFDCNSRWLSRAEVTICQDPGLSRLDDQVAKRFDAIALKGGFGQYLGLRYWKASWSKQRDSCGSDRTCISMHYRAQARFLDRLQQCIDVRVMRKACLRDSLAGDRETRQRR
jgi:uncharacterized protein